MIEQTEYDKLFKEFYKSELEKLGANRPVGMFGTWAFHSSKQKEFRKLFEDNKKKEEK